MLYPFRLRDRALNRKYETKFFKDTGKFLKLLRNMHLQAMKAIIPISLKRICTKQLQAVNDGLLSRDQAENIIKRKSRYSSRTREQIVEGLTREYDPESVKAFQFFRLL